MICFVTDRIPQFATLLEKLTDCGILLFPCSTQATLSTCKQKDIGGVIFDLPSAPKTGMKLLDVLQKSYPSMPIAVLNGNRARLSPATVCLRIADQAEDELFDDLLHFCIHTCKFRVDQAFSTSILSMSATGNCLYMGYPLKLSPTQHRILYCLLYFAPKIASAEDLILLCGISGGSAPQKLMLQISHINRRACRIFPSPLIVNHYGKGYALRE